MPATGGGMGRGIGAPGSGVQYAGGLGRGSMLGEQRTQQQEQRRTPPDLPPPELPLCVPCPFMRLAHTAMTACALPLLSAQAYHAGGPWGRHPRRALSKPLAGRCCMHATRLLTCALAMDRLRKADRRGSERP
jgi:hypothetical protein